MWAAGRCPTAQAKALPSSWLEVDEDAGRAGAVDDAGLAPIQATAW